MLAPISGLEFHPDEHRYRYRGNWLHYSVSPIASPLSPHSKTWIERTRADWEPRGVQVHKALENFLKGEPVDAGEYGQWTNAMLQNWLLQGCEVMAAEFSVCDEKRSIGGQFDFLITTAKGSVVLGDLKTVGKVDAVATRKPATAQLGGYLEMLQQHKRILVDRCVTFVVGPGAARVIPSDPDECVEEWQAARDCFLKARDF